MTRKSSESSEFDDHGDPVVEWDNHDTAVELDENDLAELDTDAITPTVAPESLAGYELGRRDERAAFFSKWDYLLAQQELRGISRAFQVVRDHMIEDGATVEVADAIMAALAKRAGVKLG
jgi:hypothetical protein